MQGFRRFPVFGNLILDSRRSSPFLRISFSTLPPLSCQGWIEKIRLKRVGHHSSDCMGCVTIICIAGNWLHITMLGLDFAKVRWTISLTYRLMDVVELYWLKCQGLHASVDELLIRLCHFYYCHLCDSHSSDYCKGEQHSYLVQMSCHPKVWASVLIFGDIVYGQTGRRVATKMIVIKEFLFAHCLRPKFSLCPTLLLEVLTQDRNTQARCQHGGWSSRPNDSFNNRITIARPRCMHRRKDRSGEANSKWNPQT
jgi:hypothetical protein